jgi:hypothetical protein
MKILAPFLMIIGTLFRAKYNNYEMLYGENIILKIEKVTY